MELDENLIDDLSQNPVFQLSLASKELFHSNFLYWLSIYNATQFKALIDKLTGNSVAWTDSWAVYREDNKFDLCVRNVDGKKEYLLVLENKVKSIVTKKQLDGYYHKVKKSRSHNCKFCLLTLAPDYLQKQEISDSGYWQNISYKEYAHALHEVYLEDGKKNEDVNVAIIRQYYKYIDYLSQDGFFDLPNEGDKWKDTHINELFQKIRLEDLRQKLIANRLALWILDHLDDKDNVICNMPDSDIWKKPDKQKIYLSAGYVNKGALIHLSSFVADDVMIRLEIEGNIYKRAVIIRKETPAKVKDNSWKDMAPTKVMELFSDNPYIEPAIKYPATIDGGHALKHKDYGTYDTNNLMKYQSRTIPDDSTISEVLEAVLDDFRHVLEIPSTCVF